MAHTMNDEKVYLSFPITKVDKTDDGDLLVWGKATDGSLDSDEQIVDPAWSGPALKTWLATGGNVRTMHSANLLPAGKGVEIKTSDDGHWVKSLIVEPTAKKLVEKGVLRAYSIGISRPVIEPDITGKAKGGIIRGNDKTSVHEISLVDRPANASCGITIVKSSNGVPVDAEELFGNLQEALAEAAPSAGELIKADDATPDPLEAGEQTEPAPGAVTAESDSRTEWQGERRAWLEAEPALGKATDGPAYLAKRAAWQKWHADGEANGLGDDGYATWLAKRDMDPNVGGGTDRDTIPAEDFAGKDRSFPIVTPKDVADAAQSIGRAGDDNYPPEKLKANIIRIARRKGEAFVAELPEAWTKDDAAKAENADHGAVAKGAKDCPKCGKTYHADSKMKRCEVCGAKLPKASATKNSDEKVGKAKRPKRAVPDDVKPAGEHREPDGSSTVEQLEPQAGMDTDKDPVEDKVPASVKAAPSYAVWRMHDALCAAYPADAVLDAYPSLKSVADAIDTGWWQVQVADTAAKGDLDALGAVVDCTRAAGAITAEDRMVLADARAHLHKSFADLHGTSLSPGSVTPGEFQRPYLSAGHAPLTARAGQTPRVPPGTHTPDPDQFHRELITTGHQDTSPGSSGENTPTVATGAARTYYTTAARDAARSAMQAMHDHIALTFPDMCPMAASKTVLPPDMGDSNRPSPVRPPATPKAPGEKAAKAKTTKPKKAKTPQTAAPALDADLIKAIVTDVTKTLRDDYETRLAALRAEVDALGRQPDPTQAPVRGVVRKAAVQAPAPVERSLPADAQDTAAKAEQQHAAYRDHLQKLAHSPDPALRMRAEAALEQLLT
ncbi:hypothetical protein [Streptomyces sp. NPDC001404]|uniref:hypothetical protein n=1 Tax=Streptomyces sp. NPDC001404 TaxID=3364571 RepID=UPI0036A5B2CB